MHRSASSTTRRAFWDCTHLHPVQNREHEFRSLSQSWDSSNIRDMLRCRGKDLRDFEGGVDLAWLSRQPMLFGPLEHLFAAIFWYGAHPLWCAAVNPGKAALKVGLRGKKRAVRLSTSRQDERCSRGLLLSRLHASQVEAVNPKEMESSCVEIGVIHSEW